MVLRAVIASVALLSSSVLVAAEPARLKMPDFSHLQSKAVDSIDVSIGAPLLALAQMFAPEKDEQGTEIKKIIGGIKAVYVRSFQFAEDNAYSQSDIDSVRKQLRDDKWQPLAQVHSRKNSEHVDIFIAIENDKPIGFAIVASEPREFTIVNVVGTIDPQHIGKLQATLDLPRGGSLEGKVELED
jgi:hypothetical protein